MPKTYGPEVVSHCFDLYIRFNGQNHDRIQNLMRKKWPSWSKQNLYSRAGKVGWIEEYGWERSLKERLAQAGERVATAEQSLFIEIEQIRKKLHERIHSGAQVDRDLVYQHLAYCRLSVSALAKLKGAGLTFDSFVAFWEALLDWLPDISDGAARALLEAADEVLEKARSTYGEQGEEDGRAGES